MWQLRGQMIGDDSACEPDYHPDLQHDHHDRHIYTRLHIGSKEVIPNILTVWGETKALLHRLADLFELAFFHLITTIRKIVYHQYYYNTNGTICQVRYKLN